LPRFPRPAEFFSELSEEPRLKLVLTGLTFVLLTVPTAIALTLGTPQTLALMVMAVAILPFMYGIYALLSRAFDKSAVTAQPTPQSIYDVIRSGPLNAGLLPKSQRVPWSWRLRRVYSRLQIQVQVSPLPTLSDSKLLFDLKPVGNTIYLKK